MKMHVITDDEEEIAAFTWEDRRLHYRGQVFVPTADNHIRLVLDARMDASLNWEEALLQADEAIKRGFKVLWELDLGLFSSPKLPLNNQTQFRSFILSLDHFLKTVWERFSSHSIGLCLYRGDADFVQQIRWETPLTPVEAAHIALDFLESLAYTLPDALICFVEIEDKQLKDPVLLAHMFCSERRARLLLSFPDAPLPIGNFDEWRFRIGVCFPSAEALNSSVDAYLLEVFSALSPFSYRILPESSLTAEWDGLDALIVHSPSVSNAGRRMLHGFAAAGGEVVTFGGEIGVFDELSFEEWQGNQVQSRS